VGTGRSVSGGGFMDLLLEQGWGDGIGLRKYILGTLDQNWLLICS
jgi:hypothetical protein